MNPERQLRRGEAGCSVHESHIAGDGTASVKETTVPVAELGVTFAAKVRASPTRDGFVPTAKATLTLVLGLLTVWASAGLTEELNLLFPVYRAVMECVPDPDQQC